MVCPSREWHGITALFDCRCNLGPCKSAHKNCDSGESLLIKEIPDCIFGAIFGQALELVGSITLQLCDLVVVFVTKPGAGGKTGTITYSWRFFDLLTESLASVSRELAALAALKR